MHLIDIDSDTFRSVLFHLFNTNADYSEAMEILHRMPKVRFTEDDDLPVGSRFLEEE